MDQGPLEMPESRGWTRDDVLELVRAVGVQLVAAAVLAAGAALVWSMTTDRLFREALTITSLVTAGLLPVLGSLSQINDAELGLHAPAATRRPRPEGDDRLTPVGVLLFVSVPVAVVGLWLGA